MKTALLVLFLTSTRPEAGKQAFDQGRYTEAESEFSAAVVQAETENSDADLPILLNNPANSQKAQGKFAQAERNYLRAFRLSRDPQRQAHPLLGLGSVNRSLGRYKEAEAQYSRALQVLSSDSTANPAHLSLILNGVAEIYRLEARFEDAERSYRQARELLRNAGLANSAQMAALDNNLGQLYILTGQMSKAGPLLANAVATWRRTLGACRR